MSDFRTVLIEDARIADITPTEVFGVQSSASQSTYQQFQAVSASNSSIVFNVQIPSENIVIDRHVLCASTVSLQITATNVPIGAQVFQYGLTDALQAFPLNSLMTTVQATINNVSVSTNLQDVLPMLMVMSDRKVLSRYNSLTPSLRDAHWGEYKDAPATNANPLASYNNSSYDEAFEILMIPVNAAIQAFKDMTDWLGLTDHAGEEAAKNEEARQEKLAKLRQEKMDI